MSRIPVNGGGGGGVSHSLNWNLISSDGLQTIPGGTVATLANGEIADVAVTVNLKKQGGGANDSAVWQRRFLGVMNTGGVLADPLGGTSDEAIKTAVGIGVSTASAQLSISGTNIVAQVQRPTGVPCYAAVTIDYVRGTVPTGGVSAPTLDPVASPFFQGAAGGGSVTITGTGLAAATVTVGSANATVTGQTSTSLTFTCPANAAATTAYTVTVTNAGGSATLTGNAGGIYYLPASVTYAWVASQGFNAGTGAWTDFIGGKVAAVYGSTTKPTLTSSWSNGQPAVTFNGTNQAIQATFADITQPVSVMIVGDETGAGATAGIPFDNAAPAGTACLLEYVASTTTASVYAGGTPVNKVASLATVSTVRCIFNGASSSISINEGTAVTGSAGSGWLQTGITFGASRLASPGNWFPGHLYLACAITGAVSGTDSGIIHGIAQNAVLSP